MNKQSIVIILGIIGVSLLTILTLSIVSIDAGNVGIHNLFGVVDNNEMQPGLHLKNPFASVTEMSVKTQEYTMTYTKGEGAVKNSDVISALTKEGLSVDLDMTILYRLNPSRASEVYKTIGTDYVNVIVRPQIRTIIREVVAKYEAKQLYSEQRNAVAINITELLEPELTSRGIILERVLIRHIQLPDQLVNSIEEKLVAEQDAERMTFILQQEQKEAERKVIEAGGIANSNLIIQESLSPSYLTWYWIKEGLQKGDVYYVPVGDTGLPLIKTVE